MTSPKLVVLVCVIFIGFAISQQMYQVCNSRGFICVTNTTFQACTDIGGGVFISLDNVSQACPANTVCNNNFSQECVDPLTVTTSRPINVTIPRANVTTTRKPVVVTSAPGTCPRTGTFGDPNDCHVYYKCLGSTKLKYYCLFDFVFNSVTGTCSSNKDDCKSTSFSCFINGYFQDPKSCYTYFTCQRFGKSWIVKSTNCPSMQSFNPFIGKCVLGSDGCKGKIF